MFVIEHYQEREQYWAWLYSLFGTSGIVCFNLNFYFCFRQSSFVKLLELPLGCGEYDHPRLLRILLDLTYLSLPSTYDYVLIYGMIIIK